MILDQNTVNKISQLFKTPFNRVEYIGVYYTGTVLFSFQYIEQTKSGEATRSGFAAHITEDFKIHKVERLKQTWGRYKGKIINEYLPIHPEGNKTTLFKLMNKEINEFQNINPLNKQP